MFHIIFRAILIVALGTASFLVAGIWGENQIRLISSKELLFAGVVGTFVILLSLSYSLRKRYWKWGKLQTWLLFHQVAALSGTAIVLWHTALRIHNVMGWAAMVLMLILCTSGIVGRYLHMEINREFARRKKMGEEPPSLSQLQWWRDHFQYWRKIHLPMTKITAIVLLIHLFGAAFFGGWQP